MSEFFENWEWKEMNPLKLLILNIILLFGGFGFIKLMYVIGGWWVILPAWIVFGCLMLGFTIFTIYRFLEAADD